MLTIPGTGPLSKYSATTAAAAAAAFTVREKFEICTPAAGFIVNKKNPAGAVWLRGLSLKVWDL